VRDLRTIVADLVATPMVETPPMEQVVARARVLRVRRRHRITAAALLVLLLTTTVAVAFEREVGRADLRLVDDTSETVVGGWADDSTPASGLSNASPRPTASTTTPTGGARASNPGAGGAPACQSAGNSSDGVTPDRIEVVTGRRTTGFGSSFLGTAHLGVKAVLDRVNRSGGICGRLLQLRIVDDVSSQTESFAVVAPMPDARLDQLDEAGVPMVGGAGLSGAQYSSVWSWPVGPSTAGTVRSMAQHAFEAGARTFGIVYDQQHAVFLEGAKAYREYVRELPGGVLKADVGIAPDKPSYNMEAQTFNELCGPDECDFVAVLLAPETALTYINSQVERLDGRKRGFGRVLTGGAPLLFTERFARDCGRHCDGMLLWTGYTPPVGQNTGDADVARYVQEVKAADPGIDVNNPFLQGAYLGTELFVQAVRDAGGNLTRSRLQRALDDLTFRSGLVTDLQWGPTVPSGRVANTAVRAVRVKTALGSFVGFEDTGTGWRRDPHPGSLPS